MKLNIYFRIADNGTLSFRWSLPGIWPAGMTRRPMDLLYRCDKKMPVRISYDRFQYRSSGIMIGAMGNPFVFADKIRYRDGCFEED